MYWAIRLRGEGTFVGICDLSDIKPGESADVGFMLLRRFWSLGFGAEVLRCLLSHAKPLGLTAVTARIHSGNERSQRLLLSAGFKIVTELPQYEIRPGVFRACSTFQREL